MSCEHDEVDGPRHALNFKRTDVWLDTVKPQNCNFWKKSQVDFINAIVNWTLEILLSVLKIAMVKKWQHKCRGRFFVCQTKGKGEAVENNDGFGRKAWLFQF